MRSSASDSIKAIVTDLDGTLLSSGDVITNRTKKTIEAIQSMGFEIIFATGRHPNDVMNLTRDWSIKPTIIGCNGALEGYVRDKNFNNIVKSS